MITLALFFLAIPLFFFVLFTVGEIVGGDMGGLVHLTQLLPLALTTYLAWKRPFIGGFLLVVIGTMLATFYVLDTKFPLQTVAFTELIIFIPPIIAGIFFMAEGIDH